MNQRAFNWILILLLVAFVLFSRVYAIDQIPPGLFGDEAVEGLDALDVLAGNFFIWFHAHLGREPIYVYLTALSYALFGVSPLATRLPALIAGLLTIPATFWLTREWAREIFTRERATRLAWPATALITISFWHIEMTRNAHRDTLLPLVEAIGYALLWRALRTRDLKLYIASGAILGLAIYTYSPGRFVGIFVAMFVATEFVVTALAGKRAQARTTNTLDWRGIILAGLTALIVMLPLGIYFAQNPAQFFRRFDSTSVFDQANPVLAFATSVIGNVAQFVVPGAGYRSFHYNLPGKPVFDLLIAPFFLAGLLIAFTRLRESRYRFLIAWWLVMMLPAFLTADMIPKGVRVFGVVPGVFIFPALAMDWLIERALDATTRQAIAAKDVTRLNRMELAPPNPLAPLIAFGLIAFAFSGSAAWTTYDYFIAWANLPEVPVKFDADYAAAADFILRYPNAPRVYIAAEVYHHPTFMLLGKRTPTSRYLERDARVREFDARTTLTVRPGEAALYAFVNPNVIPADWSTRLVLHAERVEQNKFLAAYRVSEVAPPQRALDATFNPDLKLIGVSRYDDAPPGIALYWQVIGLPDGRADVISTVTLLDARGAVIAQKKQTLGAPPPEWARGDVLIEWYEFATLENVVQFSIQTARAQSQWQSPNIPVK
ncbi:MAG: glycosyltransferase family 39 protein [Chloroflexi bacterium]|nr:glycosyltransferase family 39 protein [Chloroflexota bacterium]